MFVCEYLFSEEEDEFNLFKNIVNVATVRQSCQDTFLDTLFACKVVALKHIHLEQNWIRRDYPVHNNKSSCCGNGSEVFTENFKGGMRL